MLKKRERLSRTEFKTLLAKGRHLHNKHLSVVFHLMSESKGGVVVGKKTARKAPARNRLRRQVYSLLKVHPVWQKSIHVAVLLRPTAAHLSFNELESELNDLLTQVK